MSTLYLVATPIGNLGDLSPRAREILSTVDFIAAEDTRVTQKLLTACELPRKPMISYYEHNRRARGEVVLERDARRRDLCARDRRRARRPSPTPARIWSRCAPSTIFRSSRSPAAALRSARSPQAVCRPAAGASRAFFP